MHFTKYLIVLFTLIIAQPTAGREIRVEFGQSIQAAVDMALPGDQIKVMPGIYRETGRYCPTNPTKVCAVVVSKNDVSLVGEPSQGRPVILENFGGQIVGIAVAKPGVSGSTCQSDATQHVRGVSITGFVVRNFEDSGIFLFCADDWSVSFNLAENNQRYGIFPVFSDRGRLHGNIASGSHDTGIYIGLSHEVRVDQNIAHDNVAGFEVENSTDVEVDHNESLNNTVGILMFIEPNDPIHVSNGNYIHHNFVHDNNSANSCIDPGDDVCLVAPGIGISSVGGDQNRIAHNEVLRNETFGIILIDVCSGFGISPAVCSSLGFDPLPETTRIEFNRAEGNGFMPQVPSLPGADLIWTGTGSGNCWSDNKASTIVPPQLPVCVHGP